MQMLKSVGVSRVYIATCDAKIQTLEEIKSKLPTEIKLRGNGGTDFRPAFELARKLKVPAIIYLTDGMGTYPSKANIPTAWVLPYHATAKPPFGKVIKLPPIS
jgi:predicted metal-dependent peptidase